MRSIEVFQRFVPEEAALYCNTLYNSLEFEFKIKKARKTKLGDFRFSPSNGKHTITVNNDLNPYNFLVTYLHEVAHLTAFRNYGRSIMPHGEEWKEHFKEVAKPVLTTEVFPEIVLTTLINYFRNPKASSCSDPILYKVLKQFDEDDGTVFLQNIAAGSNFIFNERKFQKLEKRRTRSVCKELSSNKKYLIPELANVIPIN